MASRFRSVVTDGDALATFSKGFVPDTIPSGLFEHLRLRSRVLGEMVSTSMILSLEIF